MDKTIPGLFWIFLLPGMLLLHSPTNLSAQTDKLRIKATGTGQTTGHIATLEIHNPTDQAIQFGIRALFIPATRKHQGYVIPSLPEILIPPGATVLQELTGYCTDVFQVATPAGAALPSFQQWVSLDDPVMQLPSGELLIPRQQITGPLPPGFTIRQPGEPGLVLTWPGTDIPFPYIIDDVIHPEAVAPFAFQILREISITYDSLFHLGVIHTPYSDDPPRQRETVIQHTFWTAMGLLTGREYDKEDLSGHIEAQYRENTGISVNKAPVPVRKELESGIEQFWSTFTLVGVEAKVLSEPESTAAPPVEISAPACGLSDTLWREPESALDLKISEAWGDEAERTRLQKEIREAFSKEGTVTNGKTTGQYGTGEHPTSAAAFWRNNHVGGYASSYARAYFRRNRGIGEWVGETEHLKSHAQGQSTLEMKAMPGEECTSLIVGTSVVRIKASASVFDAVAGNNPESGLLAVSTLRKAWKLAMKYLIAGGKSDGKPISFSNYLKDELKSELKDQLTDAAFNKIKDLVSEQMQTLFNELGININVASLELSDFQIPDMKGLLENLTGIKIPGIDDLQETIDEGLDAISGILLASNTYATANGFLVTKVGGQTGAVQAHSRRLYLRQGDEPTAQAVTGTQPACEEIQVSDSHPTFLRIHTQGQSDLETQAKGNGSAESFLESMSVQVLVGFCFCPNQYPTFSVIVDSGWFTKEDDAISEEEMQDLEDSLNDFLEAQTRSEAISAATDGNTVKENVANFVARWMANHPYVWKNCRQGH